MALFKGVAGGDGFGTKVTIFFTTCCESAYVVAIIDWHCHAFLAWEISNKEQGSQFTGK